jgi:hypothetical protein
MVCGAFVIGASNVIDSRKRRVQLRVFIDDIAKMLVIRSALHIDS